MKTSLDISDYLFNRVKMLAKKWSTNARALVEEGLHIIISNSQKKEFATPKLLTFSGDGLTEQFQGRSFDWSSVRDEIYKAHGS